MARCYIYDILHVYIFCSALCRVSLDIMSVQGHTGPKWEDKKPKAFFRGRDSRQERLDLVKNHRNNTDMFDVGLTNFFFFEYDEQLYGPKHKAISFFDFFNVRIPVMYMCVCMCV